MEFLSQNWIDNRKLRVATSSVNTSGLGISTPTTQYIVELANLFHVSCDYILGLENAS